MHRAEPRGWTQSAAGPGPFRWGEWGRSAPRRRQEEWSRPGPSGFPRTPNLGRVCIAPDRARLGNAPVGSVSLLLCSERGGCDGGLGGICCCQSLKRHSRAGGSAVAGMPGCTRRMQHPWTSEEQGCGCTSRPCCVWSPGSSGRAGVPALPPASLGWQHSPSHFYSWEFKPAS